MFFYSIIMEAIYRLTAIISPALGFLFPKIPKFFSDRKPHQDLKHIKPADYVFFCSSAGEYDQVIPLIEKLHQKNHSTFIIFFSISGVQYLNKVSPEQAHILMPYDSTFFWSKLFERLKPKKIMQVRYEFWPAFLQQAKKIPAYLLFWSKQEFSRSPLKKTYYRWCLSHFKLIFCVNKTSQKSLQQDMDIHENHTLVSGDAKFERALARNPESNSALALDKNYLVIGGSVWLEDLEVLLPAFKSFAANIKTKLVLVPHDISDKMIQKMEAACALHRLSSATHQSAPTTLENEVVIVQSMGQLAQLYPAANFAFIGGGMHHRVHNVLEAAAANLAISFGPRHHTSHEAKLMVKEKLVKVSSTKDGLHKVLAQAHKNHLSGIPTGTLDFVQRHTGASNFITEHLTKDNT